MVLIQSPLFSLVSVASLTRPPQLCTASPIGIGRPVLLADIGLSWPHPNPVFSLQLGSKKGGLGAQKVSSQSFSELEKRAQAVDKLREKDDTAGPPGPTKKTGRDDLAL